MAQKHGRAREAKKKSKKKNYTKQDKRWKQKDIRGTVTEEGQQQTEKTKKDNKDNSRTRRQTKQSRGPE
eukprot:6537482-Ditylum_brightwellii.AAC.1